MIKKSNGTGKYKIEYSEQSKLEALRSHLNYLGIVITRKRGKLPYMLFGIGGYSLSLDVSDQDKTIYAIECILEHIKEQDNHSLLQSKINEIRSIKSSPCKHEVTEYIKVDGISEVCCCCERTLNTHKTHYDMLVAMGKGLTNENS